ncbi:hypothetical protein GCM10023405_11670 [Streptomonospora salina]
MQIVFNGLSPLIIDDVSSEDARIRVRARTPATPAPCPVCGTESARVHGYGERTLADVPVDARRVVVIVRIRRLACATRGCTRQTFREQLPGLLERHQRRTPRMAAQLGSVVRELTGRASARVLPFLAMGASTNTALRALRRLALPARPVPRVLGVDDFALRTEGVNTRTKMIHRQMYGRAGFPLLRHRILLG